MPDEVNEWLAAHGVEPSAEVRSDPRRAVVDGHPAPDRGRCSLPEEQPLQEFKVALI